MYNIKELQEAFSGLVGVRQSNIPGVPEISESLNASSSGLYVDDKNPLAATENMYYSSPNFQPSVYPAWVSGTSYQIKAKVNDGGLIFISKNAITSDLIAPHLDATNWDSYNPFNNWMLQKVTQAVPNMLGEVIKRKKLQHIGKAILERQQLYRGSASIYDKIIPKGRFVGFSILPQQAEALWVIIDKIGIQLTRAQSLTFYLYHSDSENALNTWSIDIDRENTFSWASLLDDDDIPDCIMKYLSQNTSGIYYFGYYEDDIDGNALSKSWNCNSYPCAECDGTDILSYNVWSKYTTFRNISVPSGALDDKRKLFDTSMISYDQITNWGMNFSLTVRCDLTDFIIANLYLWAEPLCFQICKEFLEAIANGSRIGPTPAQTKLSAIAALDPKAPGNWIQSYNDNIDALNLDFSGFSNACMSCNEEKKKIRFFQI